MNRVEHLLTLLMEECAEVQQCASKVLRFGLDEVKPGLLESNVERLNKEVNDLRAIIEILRGENILPDGEHISDIVHIEEKKSKVARYMEYSRSLGTLEEK